MENTRFTITIGRQFGAGGRELGLRLAEMYDMAYYDKELIAEVAKESGLSEEFIAKEDEKVPTGWMHALAANLAMGGVYSTGGALTGESIFKFQADVIQQAARERSCVIVGRCADYILREDPLCVRIFVSSSDRDRIRRIMEHHGAKDEKQALEMMKRIDRKREEYYNFYTNKAWGEAATYDLCIDSSTLGIDRTAEVVQEFVTRRMAAVTATMAAAQGPGFGSGFADR